MTAESWDPISQIPVFNQWEQVDLPVNIIQHKDWVGRILGARGFCITRGCLRASEFRGEEGGTIPPPCKLRKVYLQESMVHGSEFPHLPQVIFVTCTDSKFHRLLHSHVSRPNAAKP